MLLKVVKNEMRQRLHPNAVLPLKIDGNNVGNSQRVSLLAFSTAYMLLLFVSVAVLTIQDIDAANAVTVAISCLANSGPSLTFSSVQHFTWADLPVLSKWVSALMMLVGRLEIFSVVVILTPQFWREN